jgi:hypothetical protein
MMVPATFSREHYLNANFGWRSWLLTTDHKLPCAPSTGEFSLTSEYAPIGLAFR